jgi:putative ABC transport system permease protein
MKLFPRKAGLPRTGKFLLWLFLDGIDFEEAVGDFEERRRAILAAEGSFRAAADFWTMILSSLPGFIAAQISWRFQMIRNYLKIAYRNMRKQKAFTLITIGGLSAGIVCCLLIFMYVARETSYDRHHPDYGRVFRVAEEVQSGEGASTFAPAGFPLAPALKAEYPEVEEAARIFPLSNRLIEYGEKKFYESRVSFVDPDLLRILSFPFLEGDPRTALARPNTAVLTREMARKYFGADPAVGKTVKFSGRFLLEITGVIQDTPATTHLKADWLVSLDTLRTALGNEFKNWHNTMAYTYVKLKPRTAALRFEQGLVGLADRHVGEQLKANGQAYRYILQPVADIHLKSKLLFEIEPAGNAGALAMLTAAAVLILIIAGLNFIGLSTARSTRRAKEIGLRKVVGAERKQLFSQLLGESALLTSLSTAAAVLGTILLFPVFNSLAGTAFALPDLFKPGNLLFLTGIWLATGFGAGIYPALVLTSFKPAATLKGSFQSGRFGTGTRKVLIVGQFFLAALLITGTIVIIGQVRFMKNQDLGFSREQKLILPVRGSQGLPSRSEEIKAAFLKLPAVLGAAASSSVPGRGPASFNVRLSDQAANRNWSMDHLFIDPEFLPLYDIRMAAGRPFGQDMSTDRTRNFDQTPVFLVNEAAVRSFGFPSSDKALGQRIQTGYGSRTGAIIGVVRDFHYFGLQQEIGGLVMEWLPQDFTNLTLRVQTAGLSDTVAAVQREWKALFPGIPYAGFFLDEDFNKQYQADERLWGIARAFTILGIMISCLGLFGLAAYVAERRTKEIGIRKVLGASTPGLALSFTGDFVRLVLLANILAAPAAWWIMSQWLRGYAYHTRVTPGVFVLSAVLSLGVALLTVGYQSIRAAGTDPAVSLRTE